MRDQTAIVVKVSKKVLKVAHLVKNIHICIQAEYFRSEFTKEQLLRKLDARLEAVNRSITFVECSNFFRLYTVLTHTFGKECKKTHELTLSKLHHAFYMVKSFWSIFAFFLRK